MDAIAGFLPDPTSRKVVATGGWEEEELSADATGPLAAFVFKTVADPYVGKISFFRAFSGILTADSRVYSLPSGSEERISQVYYLRGKEQLATHQVTAGDIGVVTKLGSTATNHTLCDLGTPAQRVAAALSRSALLRVRHAQDQGRLCQDGADAQPHHRGRSDAAGAHGAGHGGDDPVGHGRGASRPAVRRMESKFGLGLATSVPKVPYNESITRNAADYHRVTRSRPVAGQFGEVHMEIRPLERGTGFEFDTTRAFGGAISNSFFPSIERAFARSSIMASLAGYPVVDVRCEVYDGKMHPVDSKDIALQIAGREVQEDLPGRGAGAAGAHHGCHHHRAGRVHGRHHERPEHGGRVRRAWSRRGARVVITAQVPMAEMQRYAIELRSITQGAAFTA